MYEWLKSIAIRILWSSHKDALSLIITRSFWLFSCFFFFFVQNFDHCSESEVAPVTIPKRPKKSKRRTVLAQP